MDWWLKENNPDMLALTGQTDDEISRLLDAAGPSDEGEEDAPEVDESVPAVSKLGEIYQLGKHRVMCASSTDETNVKLLMNNSKIDLVFTDPPYNIDYSDMNGKYDKIENDKMSDEQFVDFLISALKNLPETMYVCCSWQYAHLFRQAMESVGRPVKAFIVWNKVNPAQNLDKYYKAHEIILYTGKFGGEKTIRSDVWELKRQHNDLHPTMKPVELVSMAIQDSSTRGQIVYDAFLGSGSTLIACEDTERVCYGMELSPAYVDVIRKRYWKHINNGNEEGWEDATQATQEATVGV
jgi:DNA modification methylase